MTNRLILVLILVLAFLGIADSWYLTQAALSDTPLICEVGGVLDGCNVVAQSPYSNPFGIPLALYGVFFYGLIFVLAALQLWSPRRSVVRGLNSLGILGLLASIAFVCLQVFVIKPVCMYCFASAVISLAICLLAGMLAKRAPAPVVREWEVSRIES